MKIVRLIRHAESAANAGLATAAPDSIPLTENGLQQARELAESITCTPDLIISSPFERAIATALPTTGRFPDVSFEVWPVEEFTYLSPNRFAGTTQTDRKPHAESYWKNGATEFTGGPGAESFDHLLERADTMLAKLADHDAQNILVFSHGQFIRAAALLIKYGSHARSYVSVRATPPCGSNFNPFKPLVHALALKCRWIKNISMPFNHRVMLWMIGVGHRL